MLAVLVSSITSVTMSDILARHNDVLTRKRPTLTSHRRPREQPPCPQQWNAYDEVVTYCYGSDDNGYGSSYASTNDLCFEALVLSTEGNHLVFGQTYVPKCMVTRFKDIKELIAVVPMLKESNIFGNMFNKVMLDATGCASNALGPCFDMKPPSGCTTCRLLLSGTSDVNKARAAISESFHIPFSNYGPTGDNSHTTLYLAHSSGFCEVFKGDQCPYLASDYNVTNNDDGFDFAIEGIENSIMRPYGFSPLDYAYRRTKAKDHYLGGMIAFIVLFVVALGGGITFFILWFRNRKSSDSDEASKP